MPTIKIINCKDSELQAVKLMKLFTGLNLRECKEYINFIFEIGEGNRILVPNTKNFTKLAIKKFIAEYEKLNLPYWDINDNLIDCQTQVLEYSNQIVFKPEFEMKLRKLKIKTKFIKNLLNYNKSKVIDERTTIEDLNSFTTWTNFIGNSFNWRISPEGNKYWITIYNS
jgi:hypothetical protein